MALRLVANPTNPYVRAYHEWLEQPPPADLQVYEETAGSILSHNDSPDLPFRWSANPYRGCQHACAYCYARPTHEYLGFGAGTDFDSRICVKLNAAELLERELARRSWRRESISFSGVTDCYQPLEAVYRLTRGCLEVCLRRENPLSVVTKSYLVTRDRDLLASLAQRGLARVFLSVPFADEAMSRKIEPGAPTPARRFEAIRSLTQAGIPVGVLVAPVIPGLNDRDIPAVLERAAAEGATDAGCLALRLPGSVLPVFLERLRTALPMHAARVEARIKDMRGGNWSDSRFGCRMTGMGSYWESIEQLFEQSARRFGLSREHCRGSPLPEMEPQSAAVRVAQVDAPSAEGLGGNATEPQSGCLQLPLFPESPGPACA